MLRQKIDIMSALAERGITMYTAKKSKVIAQGTLSKIKNKEVPPASINLLCTLLECQPGDIIEWIPDETE